MRRNLLHIDCLVDGTGLKESPGALLLEGQTIIQVGSPQSIGTIEEAQITQIHGTVMPSLVNAHTHLDLTVESVSCNEMEFMPWVKEVVAPIRRGQSQEDVQSAVMRGVQLSKEGGCFTVGDIAGTSEAMTAFQNSDLLGVSFLELIGTGKRSSHTIELLKDLPEDCGVQPHSPYSCSRSVYEAAFCSNRPLATHLAETPDEIECLKDRTGVIVEFAKSIGVWDEDIGHARVHPVDAICEIATRPFLAAHCQYLEEHHYELLRRAGASVVYCPRASAFFGHENHPWKSLQEQGVNVALGTDSILCLDTPNKLTVLDDMRFLYKQGSDPTTLLQMATVNGARALGLEESRYRLCKGEIAGLIQFENAENLGIETVLNSCEMPTPVVL